MTHFLDTAAHGASGDDTEIEQQLDALVVELGKLQRTARAKNIPIVVLFEGWEAAGKGTLINRLAMALDPRGYRVLTVQSVTEQELLRPPLYRFWRDLPEPGRVVLYDRSWYDRVWRGLAEGDFGQRELADACEDIWAFERTLVDHGYVLVKFFLHISKSEQARRFRRLQANSSTSWRIDKNDLRQHRHYGRWRRGIEWVMNRTNASGVPFFVVDANDRHAAALVAFRELRNVLGDRCAPLAAQGVETPGPGESAVPAGVRISEGSSRLEQVQWSAPLEASAYTAQLQELKDQLRDLGYRIYKKRIGVSVLYEGWDAAGKGGSIRRLVSTLDPRGYEVIPIAAPTAQEKSMHYLWRFAQRLPKGGHIAVFDRTWYGRVLVERVEGFCSEQQWRRAYGEIREFENHLTRSGNVLVKLWLQIDADEQLRRFRAREETPEKRWKITDEDWRNREKRPAYEAAVEDMLALTSTPICPWTLVPANDKLYARICALRAVADAIARRLDG